MPKTLLVIGYSRKGSTEKMASEIAKGAENAGVKVIFSKG